MSTCYWGYCTCPDNQPCIEHAGHNCGLWNGIQITNPKQVNDALTRASELAIIALDADRDELDNIKDRFEQLRQDLENEKNEISRGLNNSTGFGDRRRTARRIEKAYVRLGEVHSRTSQVTADLNSINARSSNAGAMIALALLVPYFDPFGYCDCYETKRD